MIIALTEAQSCQLAMSLMASFSVGITFGGSIVMEIACPYLAKAESAFSNHERRSPKLIPRSKKQVLSEVVYRRPGAARVGVAVRTR